MLDVVAIGVGLAVGVGVAETSPKKFATRGKPDIPPEHPARKINDSERRP
jgi:hypothetical protein